MLAEAGLLTPGGNGNPAAPGVAPFHGRLVGSRGSRALTGFGPITTPASDTGAGARTPPRPRAQVWARAAAGERHNLWRHHSGTTTSGACTTTSSGERCIPTRVTREYRTKSTLRPRPGAPANTARTTLTVSARRGCIRYATEGFRPGARHRRQSRRPHQRRPHAACAVGRSSTLTFALVRRITAPADLGFVATAGFQRVAIPSTQIAACRGWA